MRVSCGAHEMASLLLKHHPMASRVAAEAPSQSVQPKRKDKYSVDYSEFDRMEANSSETQTPQTAGGLDPVSAHFAHTHDKRKQRELFERPTSEKLENAEYFKDKGNEAYGQKNYDKACYMYEKAIVHFDYTFPEDDKQERTMQDLKEKCHLNLGLALYQLRQYDQALTNLRQVLLLNPANIKAIFRQATIAYDRDEFEECQSLIDKTIEASNGIESKEVACLKSSLKTKREAYQQKLRKVAIGMLST